MPSIYDASWVSWVLSLFPQQSSYLPYRKLEGFVGSRNSLIPAKQDFIYPVRQTLLLPIGSAYQDTETYK